ncbi:DinB family protein [Ferruginibacter profundus]
MIDDVIHKIRNELTTAFEEVYRWFNMNAGQLNYQPANNGWSIRKVLEHILLTNHFLLILIKKGTVKAIAKAEDIDYADLLVDYDLEWDKLKAIGEHQSFYWNRPEHMEPSGTVDMNTIKSKLGHQLSECLNCLAQLKNGEGILYKTTMSVNGLGKIDVYHYILFLALHIKRHLAQMEKIKKEFEQH